MLKKITILIILLLATGCYNYHELNDLAIVSAIGIDKIDNNYVVSLEVVNTQENNNTGYVIYEASGKTIEEAINNLAYTCPKEIYLSHLEVIIYGEKLAKEGIKDTLDYFARNTDIRGDTVICIAKDFNAKDILKTTMPLDKINSHSIYNLIKNSHNNLGKTTYITFEELLSDYLNNYKEIVVPTVTLKKNTSNRENIYDIKTSNTGIINKDKLVTFLKDNETLGYNILTNNIKKMTIEYNCQNEYVGVFINQVKTKITPIDSSNTNINIDVKGDISKVNCDLDLSSNETIKLINKNISKKIKQIVVSTLQKSQESHIDFIGIKDIYFKNNIKVNNIDNINYHIKVNTNLFNKENSLKVVKDAK